MDRNRNSVMMVGRKPMTLPTPPQMPSVTSELTVGLTSAAASASPMSPMTKSIPVCSQSDSHAPSQLNVMRNTNPMMRMKHGMAVKRPVRMRSAATLRACSRLSCGRVTVCAQSRSMNENRMLASAASRSSPPSVSSASMKSSRACASRSGTLSARSMSGSPSTIFVAAKRRGSCAFLAYGSSRCMNACTQRCTSPSGSPACSPLGQKSM